MSNFNFINRCAVIIQKTGARCLLQRQLSLPHRTCAAYNFYTTNQKIEKPKRPMSGYVKYLVSVLPDLQISNPNSKQQNLLKMGAEMYRDLSEAEKKSLKENSAVEMQEYTRKLQDWKAGLTEEQMAELQEAAQKKKADKIKRKLKKECSDLEKPKKPMPSFFLFQKDVQSELMKKIDPALSGMDKMAVLFKLAAGEWKNMTTEDKQVYDEMFVISRAEYEHKLQEWEEERISAGQLHLVRKKVLNKAKLGSDKEKKSKKTPKKK